MVQPQEIYKKFLLKINKNDTNTNVKVPKSVFVIIFNEEKRKFLGDILDKDESTDKINDFQEILKLDVPLKYAKTYSNKVDFYLPEDFFKKVGASCVGTKQQCKNIPITVWLKKVKDIDVLLQNSDTNPSFEFRETLGIINNGKVSIYKTDFDINNAYLSYYCEPQDIDIEGYTHLDGSQSTNKTTELSLPNIEQIIDRAVVEVTTNYEDVQRMQMAFQRQQLNEK